MSKLQSKKNGVWQRLLDALSEDIGQIVTKEKLIEVSGQHNYARRIRELRAEGWDIIYNNPHGYLLKTDKKIEKNADQYVSLKLRQKVLERDNFVCQLCGHVGNDVYSDGEKVRLEVDHITPLKQGGKTVEENLWTLCSRCNAGKKSLFDYPETLKNKIISLNLSDELRGKISEISLKSGETVNSVIVKAIGIGLKKLK